jgi:hypothetical protein
MKKADLTFILLLSITICTSAQEKRNLIKTSLVFPFTESFLISYERMINTESSFQMEIVIGESLSIRPEYRYYMSEDKVAPSGAFVAPYLHYLDESPGAGILIGVQRLYKSKISLEAFIGPGFYAEGVGGWAGVNLGLAF